MPESSGTSEEVEEIGTTTIGSLGKTEPTASRDAGTSDARASDGGDDAEGTEDDSQVSTGESGNSTSSSSSAVGNQDGSTSSSSSSSAVQEITRIVFIDEDGNEIGSSPLSVDDGEVSMQVGSTTSTSATADFYVVTGQEMALITAAFVVLIVAVFAIFGVVASRTFTRSLEVK